MSRPLFPFALSLSKGESGSRASAVYPFVWFVKLTTNGVDIPLTMNGAEFPPTLASRRGKL